MPTSCCAFNCISRQSKRSGISFFRIPKDVERRKQWLHAIKRGSVDKSDEPWDPKGHERICGKHFMSGKASDNPKHPDYVPSIFDFPTTPHQQEKSLKSKCNRAAKRQKRGKMSLDYNNPDFAPSVLKNDKNNKACKKRKQTKLERKAATLHSQPGRTSRSNGPNLTI
ncbi:THAP domain-containing protein 2-like [Boleophthalmus pectinirostris]|uniref:THAP domain-containing protein 2-like n=1 Tax=Boleophthalmus pectinirostris TaxID=150288 RepID=UPI002431D191|nr:THAP domain-containing protein 2-like [Boleophthalmus pectinirostris]